MLRTQELFDILQHKYDALEAENKRNVDEKGLLKEKIKVMENQNNSKELLQNAVGVQTDSIEIMFCKECEYPADDIFYLGEHMFEFHTERYEKKRIVTIVMIASIAKTG